MQLGESPHSHVVSLFEFDTFSANGEISQLINLWISIADARVVHTFFVSLASDMRSNTFPSINPTDIPYKLNRRQFRTATNRNCIRSTSTGTCVGAFCTCFGGWSEFRLASTDHHSKFCFRKTETTDKLIAGAWYCLRKADATVRFDRNKNCNKNQPNSLSRHFLVRS